MKRKMIGMLVFCIFFILVGAASISAANFTIWNGTTQSGQPTYAVDGGCGYHLRMIVRGEFIDRTHNWSKIRLGFLDGHSAAVKYSAASFCTVNGTNLTGSLTCTNWKMLNWTDAGDETVDSPGSESSIFYTNWFDYTINDTDSPSYYVTLNLTNVGGGQCAYTSSATNDRVKSTGAGSNPQNPEWASDYEAASAQLDALFCIEGNYSDPSFDLTFVDPTPSQSSRINANPTINVSYSGSDVNYYVWGSNDGTFSDIGRELYDFETYKPDSNIVGLYSFDYPAANTLRDESTWDNNGTFFGNTHFNSSEHCVFGNCTVFDGSNDQILLGDFLNDSTSLTLANWVYMTDSPGSWDYYSIYKNAVISFGVDNDGDTYKITMWNKSTDVSTCTGGTVPTKTWTHIAATWNSTLLTLYGNGVQICNTTMVGAIRNLNREVIIGGDSLWDWEGMIDDVIIWANKSLNGSQIEELYLRRDGIYDWDSSWTVHTGNFTIINESGTFGLRGYNDKGRMCNLNTSIANYTFDYASLNGTMVFNYTEEFCFQPDSDATIGNLDITYPLLINATLGNVTPQYDADGTYYVRGGGRNKDSGEWVANITLDREFDLDTSAPVITINDSTTFNTDNGSNINPLLTNLTLNITFEDTYLFQTEVNITKEGESGLYFFDTELDLNETQWALETIYYIGNWTKGTYKVSISATDDHTKNKIKPYNLDDANQGITYYTPEHNAITIISLDGDYLSMGSWKETDRYVMKFDYKKKVNKFKYRVIANNTLYYREMRDEPGAFVVWNPTEKLGNWLDFNIADEDVEIKKITVEQVDVNAYDVELMVKVPKQMITLRSIGGTNAVIQQYQFDIDTSEPELNVLSPANNTIINRNWIETSFNVSDGDMNATFVYLYNGSGTMISNATYLSSINTTINHNFSGIDPSTYGNLYIINATHVDTNGTQGHSGQGYIYHLKMTDCVETTTQGLNITFRNDYNGTIMKSNFTINLTATLNGSSSSYNFTGETDNAAYCIYPAWANFTVDFDAEYNASGWNSYDRTYTGIQVDNSTVPYNATYHPMVFFIKEETTLNPILKTLTITLESDVNVTETNFSGGYIIFQNQKTNDYTVKVGGGGYGEREFSILYNDSTTINETLLLINITEGVQHTFTVKDGNSDPIDGVLSQWFRNFAGTWTIVAEENTNFNGQFTLYVDESYIYRVTLTKEGYYTKTLNVQPNGDFTFYMEEYLYNTTPIQNIVKARTIDSTLVHYTDTDVVNFTWTDNDNVSIEICLKVESTNQTLNLECSGNQSGTLLYTLTATNVSYVATGYARMVGGGRNILNQIGIDLREMWEDLYSTDGGIYALIIFLTIGLMGLANPILGVLLGTFALIIIFLFNIIPLSLPMLMGLIVMAGMIIFSMTRRNPI